ncbi:MAG: MBL fold metallo-hydrolase [Anaerovoracaceae bacterium]|jgi:hydroxyacylglutathione hydrolase
MMMAEFMCGPLGANCYVVSDEVTGKGFMVDPGGTNPRMEAYIQEKDIKIEYIILTHGHGDHIGGAPNYLALYNGSKLVAAEGEKEMLNNAGLNFSMETYGERMKMDADMYVRDEDTLEVGNLKLKFLATPGHTPGGMCIYMPEDGILFSGDTLFAQSVGRTDFPRSSFEQLSRSIMEKLYTLPDETIVYPGHMGATTIGTEKEFNPFV